MVPFWQWTILELGLNLMFFLVPIYIGKGGIVCTSFIVKRLPMIIKLLFEITLRGTLYLVCLVIKQCIYILCQWLNIHHLEGSQILLSNYLTSVLWHLCWSLFCCVRFYHAPHVVCARIANLYSVSVENCVKFVRFWKLLI